MWVRLPPSLPSFTHEPPLHTALLVTERMAGRRRLRKAAYEHRAVSAPGTGRRLRSGGEARHRPDADVKTAGANGAYSRGCRVVSLCPRL
jgi:hypothetical protein